MRLGSFRLDKSESVVHCVDTDYYDTAAAAAARNQKVSYYYCRAIEHWQVYVVAAIEWASRAIRMPKRKQLEKYEKVLLPDVAEIFIFHHFRLLQILDKYARHQQADAGYLF